MSCTHCGGSATALSTLSSTKLDVVVDHDVDPKAATIEFAVVASGATPGGGDWAAGVWVDADADTVTDKATGREGLYGWLARTGIVGPLAEGDWVLWVKISSGGEEWVATVDDLDVT